MTLKIDVGDADLTDLLAKVEAGEDVILLRDQMPVALISGMKSSTSRAELIETIIRERAGRKRVTQEEIAEWKQIGRL
jgi:antitoxin (DNA-binding transcriptional repressor) of toxin-antitoxin stability system